jgi:hypothetical protein
MLAPLAPHRNHTLSSYSLHRVSAQNSALPTGKPGDDSFSRIAIVPSSAQRSDWEGAKQARFGPLGMPAVRAAPSPRQAVALVKMVRMADSWYRRSGSALSMLVTKARALSDRATSGMLS